MGLFRKKYNVSDFFFFADAEGNSSIMLVDNWNLTAVDLFNHKETNYFAFYKKPVSEYCNLSDAKLTLFQIKKETVEGFKKFKEYVQMEIEARHPKKLKNKVEHKKENNTKYDSNVVYIGEEDYVIK